MKDKDILLYDKYQTPPNVSEFMVSLLPSKAKHILEPTPGKGNIVKCLKKNGFLVTAPEDYFLLDKTLKFDGIVLNPPFSSKSLVVTNAPEHYLNSGMKCGYNILFECLEKSNNIIALMPWYTISDSDVRMRKIIDFGLKSLTVLPRKTFNYARIQTCVIELEKGWMKETIFNSFEFIYKNRILNEG